MESKEQFRPDYGLRLMRQVRQALRFRRFACSTERPCCDGIVRFMKVHGMRTHTAHCPSGPPTALAFR